MIVITGAFGILGRAAATLASSSGARIALLDFTNADAPSGDKTIVVGGVDLADPKAAEVAMGLIFSA